MVKQLILTRGLPRSGKDTFATAWVDEDKDNRVRVNRDEIRFNLYNAYVIGPKREDVVTHVQRAMVEAAFREGQSVVISDTNLRASTVKDWMKVADKFHAEVEFVDIDTPLDECIRRDKAIGEAGGRKVGEDVIRSFYARYFRKGKFPQVPEREAVTAASVRQYVADPGLQTAYIFDVDGTTMHNKGGRGFFDWTRVAEDTPDEHVIEVAQRLKQSGAAIIVVSGRDEICKDDTVSSLIAAGMPIDAVFMRPAGSMEKDSIVKERILFNDIAHKWNVRGVFDDRNQVVEFWRAAGILCYQVADGDF
jgi:predicted kinase